jgi:acetyl/propionyl-CoA carboxylase alpha subunit
MLEAAVAFGRAIAYRSAGTVEFVVDGDDFFFLELNGRIQVEHPVTELLTGLDLVAEQIRIARGEELGHDSPASSGHAVEVRVYAEDPRTFLPQTGRIERLVLPSDKVSQGSSASIRVDAGVEEGDEIGLAYDPMIAKLIAHGRDRADTLARLAAALDETVVDGVTTNLPFLRWLVTHPVVTAGEANTAFLTEHPPLSQPPRVRAPEAWRRPWRLNLPTPPPAAPPDIDAAARMAGPTETESAVLAPMPGTVIRVDVATGDTVQARQALVVLEAMKMEIPVHSPFAGTVSALHASVGERVAGGAVLVELGPELHGHHEDDREQDEEQHAREPDEVTEA